MSKKQQLKQIFSKDGLLSQSITQFQPRNEQIEMAHTVLETIEQKSQLIIEAGTGTGKTFAYLIPALLSQQKAIISTGSKNLQDQLFQRDLPTITKAMGFSGKIALLKGRANYLCLERLDRLHTRGFIGDRSLLNDFRALQSWRNATKSGDLNECTALAEDSTLIPQIVSTAENCLGSDCPFYKDCFVLKARKKALDADLVVINHHLFFADMAIKEEGFGELIPNAQIIIFDEAHQLPTIACQYFGETLSSRQLFELCHDTEIVYRTELKDMKQLGTAADIVQKVVQDFRLLLGIENQRGDLRQLFSQEKVVASFQLLQEKLSFLLEAARFGEKRSETLDKIIERITTLLNLAGRLQQVQQVGYCYWFETFNKHFSLHITPLTIADKFQQQINKQEAAWIFTSATLDSGDNFSHYAADLGITTAQKKILHSPFNYPEQALLCIPRYLPESNRQHTLEQLAKMLLPIIEANQGNCFLLCTSNFMMKGFADYLRSHSKLNVLLQGETSKSQLLQQFTRKKHSVLVATQSFWEGVDVRGDALSLVIIDKLPFAAPDEPLLKARMEDCRLQGGDPFYDIQLPETIITLKQGVGRLIRDVNDRGAIIICDARLVMRPYGQLFLKSLPPAQRTRDLGKVVQFLQKIRNKQ
ncbi:ATP-dependent helicase [Gallibacterium salpingitidis]|uniref:ATP-dependent DNA helicase YoaA n=1 Tax=Gallibacterium salpingitidis TaxID=505341 RepID=A0AB36E037_9PAST|nr:ATP-dependent DNA helicase [Gallibacterium salpingitidis]OBX07555.1 ATP-dependent helicase [Gallibacterium salpingitidis]OBX09427.1 ATP-dependent helicase [Gallibacterium salpingitidis]